MEARVSDPARATKRATKRGLFITVEGGEGVGKTTQVRRLAERIRTVAGDVVELREPGGTPVGDRIRELLLDPAITMSRRAELLLYEASRAQLVEETIVPALERGAVVVCDRFFDSTTAYQAYGRGLDLAEVERLNLVATGGLRPDVTVLLTLGAGFDLDESMRRATAAGADRMESEPQDFHGRVHDGFLAIAETEPSRFVVVDAAGAPDEVADSVWAGVSAHPALRAALGT
jgi:dTMP kinase